MTVFGPGIDDALWLSLQVGLWGTGLSLPLALAVAWLLARRRFWGRRVLDALVHAPLVLPPVLVGYGLLLLLGRNGALGAWLYDGFGITLAFTWQGAAVAAAVMGFPLMVRAMRASIEAVDPRLETAARTLGAGPLTVFATITLPLIWPGIVAGAVLGFARALGEFGATITFVSNIPGETRTLPLALYNALQIPDGEAAAFGIAALSLTLALAALALADWLAPPRPGGAR